MKIPQFIVTNKVKTTFQKIYRQSELEHAINTYYTEKIKKSLAIFVIGIIVFCILRVTEEKENAIVGTLKRNDYLAGKKHISLEWSFDETFPDKNTRLIDYSVSERKYTEHELEAIKIEFMEKLENILLSENESFDHISDNLNFVSKLSGYPFSLSYMTDKPTVISSKGVVNTTKISEEGEIVVICINLRYEDYDENEYIPASIYSKDKTSEELAKDAVIAEIDRASENSKYDEVLELPNAIFGERVYFRKINKNISMYMLLLSTVFSLAIFFAKDNELKEFESEREKELNSDYPRMVSKFVLFYNAGFSVNVIWHKLCSNYEKSLDDGGKRRYVFEEMLVSKAMMSDGVNELEAYEDFGNRCGLPKYKLFSSLISQAVVKGKNDMSEILRGEADKAFIEQKNNAKRLSEEAGTKLLIPMFMMLAIVMIMVMLPAFKSFGG